MAKKTIISRIHKHIGEDLLKELDAICNNVIISDNNIKVKAIRAALDKHGVMYNELGPGTNRFAVHIDGYAFKIAMDRMGKLDNANEFSMSKELQPFVIKVYENNDLISVSEYVTLISREEFLERREEILEVLGQLADSYLLGDVGYVEKNFTNWGFRDNGDVVILDFAYIHYIEGHELLCRKDGTMLEYTDNFHFLKCPSCGKKYTFSTIRAKIPMEKEWEYINLRKSEAYKLVDPSIQISKKDKGESKLEKFIKKQERDDKDMGKDRGQVVESNYGESFSDDMAALLAAKRAKQGKVEPQQTQQSKPDSQRHQDNNKRFNEGKKNQQQQRPQGNRPNKGHQDKQRHHINNTRYNDNKPNKPNYEQKKPEPVVAKQEPTVKPQTPVEAEPVKFSEVVKATEVTTETPNIKVVEKEGSVEVEIQSSEPPKSFKVEDEFPMRFSDAAKPAPDAAKVEIAEEQTVVIQSSAPNQPVKQIGGLMSAATKQFIASEKKEEEPSVTIQASAPSAPKVESVQEKYERMAREQGFDQD